MTAAQQRKAQRIVHLAAALVLVAYLYAPFGGQLHDVARFIVVPVLALTGIAMWQAPRIRRLLRAGTRTRSVDLAASPSPAEPSTES
jgi:thiosulfate reductase cytochrome b subunit